MSRSTLADTLPPTAKSISLILSSYSYIHDSQPGVLHQLLEFSHRYTTQVLSDASVYAEHAGRSGKLDMEDVVLGVQARVGWEFGGRVPKEYILSLATQVNAAPLPAVPEVFGVRLPPSSECLTAVDFDLVPNKPPPGVKLYDEEVEEIEESETESESEDEEEDEEDEEEDMEPAAIPHSHSHSHPTSTFSQDNANALALQEQESQSQSQDAPFPISAIQTPSDMDMIGTPGAAGVGVGANNTSNVDMDMEGSENENENEEEDGLFAGGDDDEESDAMEEVQTALGHHGDSGGPSANGIGIKRKLVEEDDYD